MIWLRPLLYVFSFALKYLSYIRKEIMITDKTWLYLRRVVLDIISTKPEVFVTMIDNI